MKYFVISDVHGDYKGMIAALRTSNFNAATDTLITNGDMLDRGTNSYSIIQYLLGLPHWIGLMGNHEMDHLRLIGGKKYDECNNLNGVKLTVADLVHNVDPTTFFSHFADFARNKRVCDYIKYLNSLHFCACIDHYNITHGWVPQKPWDLSAKTWEQFLWIDTGMILALGAATANDETNIIGHWGTCLLREQLREDRINYHWKDDGLRCETLVYFSPHQCSTNPTFIALDGSGVVVNVFEFESDSKVNLYDPYDDNQIRVKVNKCVGK